MPSERQCARGKIFVFVVEERDSDLNGVLLPAFFEMAGADKKSGMVGYRDFLAGKEITADVLILRFSAMHEDTGGLRASLEAFKGPNPKSAVVLCTILVDKAKQLGSLVDIIHQDVVFDTDLMEEGTRIADSK